MTSNVLLTQILLFPICVFREMVESSQKQINAQFVESIARIGDPIGKIDLLLSQMTIFVWQN